MATDKKTTVPKEAEVQAEFESQGCVEAWSETNYDSLMTFTREANKGGANAVKVVSVEDVGKDATDAERTAKQGFYYPTSAQNGKPCYEFNGHKIYWDGKSWKAPGLGATNRSDGEYPKDGRWTEGFGTKIKTMKINFSTWAEAIWNALPEFAKAQIQERSDRLAKEKAEEEARVAAEKAAEEKRLAEERAAAEAAEAAAKARQEEFARLSTAIAKSREMGLTVNTDDCKDDPGENEKLAAALGKAGDDYWAQLWKSKFGERAAAKDDVYIQNKAGDWLPASVKSKVSPARGKWNYECVVEKGDKKVKVTIDSPKRILAAKTYAHWQELFGSAPPGAA